VPTPTNPETIVPTRRSILKGLVAVGLGGLGLAGYAFGIEPYYRLTTANYRLTPPGWPPGLKVRLAILADLHAAEPYMGVQRVTSIVERTQGLAADAILLLGDYAATHRWVTRKLQPRDWAVVLGQLKAPLGVHAVLGNHDWWSDERAQRAGKGPVAARRELERAGIAVYENDAVRLTKNGQGFWLAGLGDQIAFLRGYEGRRRKFAGVDDLPGTLGKITDAAPVILMAHEPDVFTRVPARVALTISGHTHGGQVRLFGWSPVVPSQFGNRFAYGHIVEEGRNLIVSGGLGCSILPVRFGVPPEITVIDLG
jgi:predicted MPP superfamily phosphohydrolase